MPKCKYRTSDGKEKQSSCCRPRWCFWHTFRYAAKVFFRSYFFDWDRQTTLVCRPKRKLKKLCEKVSDRNRHTRRRRLLRGTTKSAPKRKKICMGFAAVDSRPFISPAGFIQIRNAQTTAKHTTKTRRMDSCCT